jgi:hypothetical protein
VDIELWMVLVTVLIAAIPWAMSIHAKVAVIASSVESLPAIVGELREVLQEHEFRLDQHAKEIQALKKTTASGD